MTLSWIEITDRKIGPGHPCFVVAEAGVNHNGSLELACKLVDAAVQAGADAVKFQTFKAEKLASSSTPKAKYQLQTTGEEETQLEMLRRLELSKDLHKKLQAYCKARNIIFISTPFDEDSADILFELGVPLFKISSGEITNVSLLEHVAVKGLPIILSTGMSDITEVGQAVKWIRKAGNDQIVLLHCVSNYPAIPEDVNLRAMEAMRTAFQLPVGYSDHTTGIAIALAAVALGACVIEKHFTLDRKLPGPDHQASIEPDELVSLVEGVRQVEASLGHGSKEPAASEADTAAIARKSLVAAINIAAGTRLEEAHIAVMRPGTGLPPAMRSYLVGRRTREIIPAGTVFTWEMLE